MSGVLFTDERTTISNVLDELNQNGEANSNRKIIWTMETLVKNGLIGEEGKKNVRDRTLWVDPYRSFGTLKNNEESVLCKNYIHDEKLKLESRRLARSEVQKARVSREAYETKKKKRAEEREMAKQVADITKNKQKKIIFRSSRRVTHIF